ncbi:transcription repressor OFP13-like [Prosopis cineraria]|uniref:transcription repressor OFP13-like n=1 Tax=Prosopis cineraria TaxID=364024 RepID=UPI00241097D2|nr:transcription repressor OFP13-like [Prosopis cineraria]
MKLSSLFKTTKRCAPKLNPCQFMPYCAQVNTLSFRKPNHTFVDPAQTLWSNRFTTSSSTFEPKSFSSSSSVDLDLLNYCDNSDHRENAHSLENLVYEIVRSSKRLFFEPNSNTSSVLETGIEQQATNKAISVTDQGSNSKSQIIEPTMEGKEKADDEVSFCESSVFLALDSNDPYEDFKKSMKEMIEFHEVKDWERLQELLSCYLIANEKKNHEFILRAFFDLFSIET